VDRRWRGKGLGQRIIRLLLDHPAVRRAGVARLSTRDAHGFYEKYGFVDAEAQRRSATLTDMVRVRP
jgi:predicted N-acetyltransferase YhbS